MAAARIKVTAVTMIITKPMKDNNQDKYNTSTVSVDQPNMRIK
jgi:hypothetical protein